MRRTTVRTALHRVSGLLRPGPAGAGPAGDLSGVTRTNAALTGLRDRRFEGTLADTTVLAPGFVLRADPALRITGRFRAPRGRIIELHARMRGEGQWVGLHLELPLQDVSACRVLGFAARISSGTPLMARACLRSLTGDGFEDHFFARHLLFRPEEAHHADAMPLQHRHRLPAQAPLRELIFFLPLEGFDLSLIDLRVFWT